MYSVVSSKLVIHIFLSIFLQESKTDTTQQISPGSEPATLSPSSSDDKPIPAVNSQSDVVQVISLNKVGARFDGYRSLFLLSYSRKCFWQSAVKMVWQSIMNSSRSYSCFVRKHFLDQTFQIY